MLSNVSVPLLGAVDTAVVGHLSEAYYIGAVAIGAMLFNYLYHLFNCLRMGTTGPTAQARGAGEYAQVRALMWRALLLAFSISAVLIALHRPILTLAFMLIDASPRVEQYAREYFLIRIWAMPAVLGGYAMVGWFYGLRDARSPLVMQLLTNVLNIGLDLLFVFGFGWGVAGVATASVIAAYAGLLLGLLYVRHAMRAMPEDPRPAPLLDRVMLARMVSINSDIVLRTLCVVSVLAFFMAKSAALGELPLAANQILHMFLVFTSFALDGFANAAEAILGEAVGRRDRAAFARAKRVVFIWAAGVGVLSTSIYALLGTAIIAVMTDIAAVRAQAEADLLWPVLMPLVSVWAYTYDGIYLAATQTRIMRNTIFASFAVFLILLHTLMPLYGNSGLWIAVAGFLGLRGLLLHLWLPRLLRTL